MADENDPVLLTPDEAARLARVSKTYLRQLEATDSAFPRPWRSPSGRVVRYDRDRLLTYLTTPPPHTHEAWNGTDGPPAALPAYLRRSRRGA